jgi:hypothetical protein
MSPTRSPKYADWQTKSEAAEALGVNEKTIERLAAAKQLKQAFRPEPGKRAAAVYDPADVARVLEERRAKKEIALTPHPARVKPISNPAWLPALQSIGPALEALKALAPVPVPIAQKLMLTLDEAVIYSGMPKAYLLERIRDGRLAAVKYGRWYIRRAALEAVETWL